MSLETSTYINGLVTSNPTSSDPVSQGDDHIKLIKSTIKNTFPNVTNAVTTTHTEINMLNDATNLATNSTLVKRSSNGSALFNTVSATTLTGTVSTAAQPNITTVGALNAGSISSSFGNINNGSSSIQTTGTITSGKSVIDSITINGSNIGHNSDLDLMTLSNGALNIEGALTANSVTVQGNISLSGTVDSVDIAGLNTALTSGTKSDSRIANILNRVYPVGSVYTSLTQSTSPANLFGGVWSAVGQGRVLMGHGQGTDKNGETYNAVVGAADNVGEYEHTLTNGEMPRHDHVSNRNSQDSFNRLVMDRSDNKNTGSGFDTTADEIASNKGQIIGEEGNDLPHNNQQPHLVVYMWRRVS